MCTVTWRIQLIQQAGSPSNGEQPLDPEPPSSTSGDVDGGDRAERPRRTAEPRAAGATEANARGLDSRGCYGLELLFNRDERRTRGPALPPRVIESQGGTRIVAPIDSEAGGTWIAANEHGLAVALVNLYQAQEPRGPVRSRGLLTLDLAAHATFAELVSALAAERLERYAGFRLLAFGSEGNRGLFAWDGVQGAWAHSDQLAPPVISSGYDLPGVEAARRKTFAGWIDRFGGPTPEALAAFHASQEPEPGPYAVRMARSDARTVSTTRLVVDSGTVRMEYTELGDGPGAQDSEAHVAELTPGACVDRPAGRG